MTTLEEYVEKIQSRNDFVKFTRALLKNFKEHPEQWENDNLALYLDALAAWVEDMEGYYHNKGEPVPNEPTWMVLGQILVAAKIYE